MAIGVPINSLSDLIMLQQLENQNDPSYQFMKGLSDSVSAKIAETQELAKKKKEEEAEFSRGIDRFEESKRRFGKDFDVSYSPKTGTVIKSKSGGLSKIPKGFKIKSINAKGEASYEPEVKDISSLSPDQQLQARALSRRLFGVKGAEKGLPTVVANMVEGKNVDEIEDAIRLGRQSSEFEGPVRSAAQSILATQPISVSQNTMDFIDDNLSQGDIEGTKNILKKVSRDTAGVEQARNIQGKERTVEFLREIQDDLDLIESKGIDTNIFTGTIEDINKKIGRVNNPELRKIATKIQVAIQTYRRSMSGVAFSVPESKEYQDMFPGIGRTANFNKANIDALGEVMQGDLENFYSLSMGRDNYNKLFKQKPDVNIKVDNVEDNRLPDIPSKSKFSGMFF